MQVAHFEPETVYLCGEAIFPRISLNLPRHSTNGELEQILCTARENLLKEANKMRSDRPISEATQLDADNVS